MTRTLFLEDWQLQRGDDGQVVPVRLPHDAMIGEARSADAATGNHGGYFPGGVYRYSKQWQVPADADSNEYRLFFEGVYGHTKVSVDGHEVAACISGYRAFYASLKGCVPGQVVTIEVLVDNSQAPNTRWYSGSGINRPVWLDVRSPVHIADDGIHLVTRSLSPKAVVDVAVHVEGATGNCMAHIRFANEDGQVASAELDVVEGVAKGTVDIPNVQPWSAETPYLYAVTVQIKQSGELVDEETFRTGLRTIEVDAEHGLRINGVPVLLRGACVHSDNGLLGTVSLPAAEYRRARILKESGYNAIRASHNPFQSSFLDACDELGLYVMDELTDVWFKHKTKYDNAEQFDEVWPADASAMIAGDRNRPAVIMYSIGNEISETATAEGVEAAAKIHDFFKHSDPTRPTTLAVNLLLNLMASKGSSPFEKEKYAGESDPKKAESKKKEATSTAANMVTAKLGMIMGLISRLPAADRVSRDVFATVDIAGYNYAYGRYKGDRKKYPQRVIMGSESMPGDLPAIWQRVTSVPGVIGDFMWTGWDYLGESGIGSWSYGEEPGGINKPFPALLAGCGAIDITGVPGAPTLLAKAVWGLLDAPAIAVRPLMHNGKRTNKTPWRSTDAVVSWAWQGVTGKAIIEVYSCDDKVELWLNGRSLGRKKAGVKAGFVTRFCVPYEAGELMAVGYRKGRESGRSSLRSADKVQLQLRAEKTTLEGLDDLAYIAIELADNQGVVESMIGDRLSISVAGAGELMGFGSANPTAVDTYTGTVCSTYLGRAQAIVRGTEAGEVTITVRSERHGDAQLTLKVSLGR
ncbi:glycoside hydrolase family 2 protein [Aestuariicella hydrocarbonica]|uniref:Glycoside hydrolase family 2 protein n=1 Tax=Pseudomaricurvus hydrocarbonicus TaxID=1470433 RepID=A0A9E5JUB4_9GAMM|nr:glycoside hydrolase family 2 TIM barrel-domain containing protein [Aestuariicella hydrocarbonica]NHO65626.1 glycoside hydrolase family 2 protein [Aestuariicella hydrocarbonica]